MDEPKQDKDPFAQFEVAKRVTIPLLKQGVGEKIAVMFTSNIFLGAELKAKRGDSDNNKPAHLAMILNLITGELMQMICPALLKSALEETYPNKGYVGRCFLIMREQKKQAAGAQRSYNTFTIDEIKKPKNIGDVPTENIEDKSVATPEPATA